MKSETLLRVLNWFNEYQGEEDKKEMVELYGKLIEEEKQETEDAYNNKDLVEYLDWIGDVFFVRMWKKYFASRYCYIDSVDELFISIVMKLKFRGEIGDIANDLINAITKSNYTKSLEKQKDWEKKWKIVKGENFVPPTEDIKKIIDKYNILFK